MSNVSLSIGGRSFTVACAAGEEAHVAGLGKMIDAKLASMGDMSSQSESRMLLFAALLLADDLHETKSAPPSSIDRLELADPEMIEALEEVADRLENLAERLESGAANA